MHEPDDTSAVGDAGLDIRSYLKTHATWHSVSTCTQGAIIGTNESLASSATTPRARRTNTTVVPSGVIARALREPF